MDKVTVTFDPESAIDVVKALRSVMDIEALARVGRTIERVKSGHERREQMLADLTPIYAQR